MQIKRTPEDFRVNELASRTWQESGTYWVYQVTCTDLTTHQMTIRLSAENGLRPRDIRYAGTKDRRAITTQFITSPKQLSTQDELMTLTHIGFTDHHLSLGDLEANEFIITIYDVKQQRDVHIPNYFGDQRFSSENVEIGLQLMNGQYAEVAERLRDQFRQIDAHLKTIPTDAVGALRKAPRHSLILYMHAVQSWLFNEAVRAYVQEHYSYEEAEYRHGTLAFPTEELPDTEVPLVGAAQALGEWEQYYGPLLRKHQISPAQFYNKALPYLTQEGTMRSLRSDIRSLNITQEETHYTLTCTLGTGCYATVVLAGLFL